jgi:uncharacterized membrane protein
MLDPEILSAVRDSWLGESIRSVSWLFAALETVHFIGICTLIGAMLVVDLRLLNVIRGGAIREVLGFARLAIAGFVLAFLSGVAFFASNPDNYDANPLFWIKMGLVLVAGLNLAWFELAERRKVLALPEGASSALDTKLVAGLSLLLWAAIIVAGRFLPLLGIG